MASSPQLLAPVEQLLASGGDTRLRLDPGTQLNGYGCRPYPRPEAFTFASSTATSISDRGFAAASAARGALLRDSKTMGLARAYSAHIDALRVEVERQLSVDGIGCAIVLSPSGTDSQLHAIVLARHLWTGPIEIVVAASDETGSGTDFVARGCHFNDITAQGVTVTKGGTIPELACINRIGIPMRDARGTMRAAAETDDELGKVVDRSLAAGNRIILFAMDSSKFGLRCPTRENLSHIQTTYGGRVQIVIDACQTRLPRKRLRWYVQQGFMVLITGSKFFTGAPFSGALIMPADLASRCRDIEDLGHGIADYSNRSDWPAFLPLRDRLPDRVNFGQWLRWVSAVAEMRGYFDAPLEFRKHALSGFAQEVPSLLAAHNCLEPLIFEGHERQFDIDDEEMSVATIFPFFVRDNNGRRLSYEEAIKVYRALNDDVSSLADEQPLGGETQVIRQRCHIGQPVAVRLRDGIVAGALRISAGARVISENWCGDMETSKRRLLGEFEQIRVILDKIRLLNQIGWTGSTNLKSPLAPDLDSVA